MKEASARIFFLALATIAKCNPLVALLENVVGLLRVWDKARPLGTPKNKVNQICSFSGMGSLAKAGEVWVLGGQGNSDSYTHNVPCNQLFFLA